MKQKLYVSILGIEAIVCIFFSILQSSERNFLSFVMAFPFESIGRGLRFLSLSGTVGNIVAIALYVLICLVPFGVILIKKKRGLNPEERLLYLLSITLFVVLYVMINPGLGVLISGSENMDGAVIKATLACMVYSILSSYIVLRILRLFFSKSIERLQQYMHVLLVLLNGLFVYKIFGMELGALMEAFTALKMGNIGNEHMLGPTYVSLGLQYLVDILPYILNIFIVFTSSTLLHEMAVNRYSEESVLAAQNLSTLCARALTITVLSGMVFNLLQLIFAKILSVVNAHVQIPILSIVFVLIALLLARWVGENKALKEDNDGII